MKNFKNQDLNLNNSLKKQFETLYTVNPREFAHLIEIKYTSLENIPFNNNLFSMYLFLRRIHNHYLVELLAIFIVFNEQILSQKTNFASL